MQKKMARIRAMRGKGKGKRKSSKGKLESGIKQLQKELKSARVIIEKMAKKVGLKSK